MSDQTRISVPDGEPPKAKGHDCEWCGEPATVVVERMKKIEQGMIGSGMFIFACNAHEAIAKANSRPMTPNERDKYQQEEALRRGSK